MEQSMRRFMKVGLVLHAAYRGLGDGGGPILECLGKVVQDDYFDAVEVAHIHDPDVRRAAAWFLLPLDERVREIVVLAAFAPVTIFRSSATDFSRPYFSLFRA